MGRHGEIMIGWASTSITPDKPVQLQGQFYERVSRYVRDPVTATALALEGEDQNGMRQQAVIVSCDLAYIPDEVQREVRTLVRPRLEGLDPSKIILAATHTHTAPVMRKGFYPDPGPGVMDPTAYVGFLLERLADVIVQAWSNRSRGGVSWALGHAAIGFNRRVVYDDGISRMYGSTDTPHFRNVEGSQDHGVEMLFCWDMADKLTGIAINVACPSQVVEHKLFVSADFWAAARKYLRQDYSDDLFVLPLVGAAGDQSPRDLIRRGRGEADMYDEDGLEEKGRRIANAVSYVFERARQRIKGNVIFEHLVEDLVLPARRITPKEAREAQEAYDEYAAKAPVPGTLDQIRMLRLQRMLEQYQSQGEHPQFEMELHALRLGDIALVTNPFELFLDYGMRIKARSMAEQTFIAQLACGRGGYLPTAKALAGSGYGAMATDGPVGPDGGETLVEHTVALINSMWQG